MEDAMTIKRVYVFCGVVLSALAITFLRVSANKAEVNSNSLSPTVFQQEIASEPKSTIGVRSVMAVVIKEVL
ncbi:MAG: hypothetical protein C5B55_05490, partial [Blastocatellia bacterium]